MAHIFFSLEFRKDKQGVPFFASFPFIVDGKPQTGISCGISSRFAGDMKNDRRNQNRIRLFGELGLNSDNVFGLNQIHSRSVLFVDGKNEPVLDADGMVTNDRNVTLSVTVADCLPVFLLDTKSGTFGLVHSGWKGTGIAIDAIALMKERFGTKLDDVAAILGPCIDSCCYRVDKERACVFEKEFGKESVRKSSGNFYLDLKNANIMLLSNYGVQNIAVCKDCTFTDDRLGSFRREGGLFTHMAALLNC
ncbi:MAG: peptidoglycan editing factor PgeF [Treponema sp.]|nr:peptidoglycan editing factor PgeF [Treponema sp.]